MTTKIQFGIDREAPPGAGFRLQNLIQRLKPTASEVEVAIAVELLIRAIADYRESFPILDGALRTRGSLSEARQDLRSLATSKSTPSAQTFMAHHALLRAGGSQMKANSTAPIAVSAQRALENLAGRHDHETDEHREVLACEVARILRDVLQLKVSLTRDEPGDETKALPGAAYARLLRCVLAAAGAQPPVDSFSLMRAGKRLLESI